MFYCIIVPLAWLVWHIAFRIHVVGREHLIQGRGFVLAPNHISAIDPVFVVIARFWGKKMLILAKEELFEKNAFLTWFLLRVGAIPLARGKADTGALDEAIRDCREGRGLLIFPEGTRSKTGQVAKPKSGAFVIASMAGVDMIPCRILYDTPQGFMRLFCRVRVCFGPAIPAEKLALGQEHSAAKLRVCKQLLTDSWQALYDQYHF